MIKHLQLPELTPEVILRFQSKLPVGLSEDKCWMWLGTWGKRNSDRPEPNFKIGGIYYNAARIAYLLHYKQDPGILLVCHTCDDSVCVNPKHLFLGTHKVNYADSMYKGRRINRNGEKLPAWEKPAKDY